MSEDRDLGVYYILRGKTVVPVRLLEWAEWYETANEVRRVAKTTLENETEISTVFLGIDHSFSDTGPPIIFETMIFGGPLDQEMDRYATWDQAVAGHEAMVERARQAGKGDTEKRFGTIGEE